LFVVVFEVATGDVAVRPVMPGRATLLDYIV